MASFRILNQAPQYLLANGAVNAGGKLYFYETDLTTPKNTWAEQAMSTLNSNPLIMDAAGRTLTDAWGDGEYGVVMTDADDVVIWTRNNVQASTAAAAGEEIPALVDGRFLTNDGSELLWADILQVPDPTGLANYMLVSDGTAVPVWQQIEEPVIPTPEYDVQAGYIRIGTLLIQWGTGTVPAAASAQTANVAITFGEAFSATPYAVLPTLSNSGGSTASGRFAALSATSLSTTGATITANVGEDDTRSDFKLTNTTPFTYVAIGPTTEPEA